MVGLSASQVGFGPRHEGTSRLSSIQFIIGNHKPPPVPQSLPKWEQLAKKDVSVICLVVLAVDGQEEEGNTVGAIPGQAGRDYPNFQVNHKDSVGEGAQLPWNLRQSST